MNYDWSYQNWFGENSSSAFAGAGVSDSDVFEALGNINTINYIGGFHFGLGALTAPFWGARRGFNQVRQQGGRLPGALLGGVAGAYHGLRANYFASRGIVGLLGDLYKTHKGQSVIPGQTVGPIDASTSFAAVPFYAGAALPFGLVLSTGFTAYQAARAWQRRNWMRAAWFTALATMSGYYLGDLIAQSKPLLNYGAGWWMRLMNMRRQSSAGEAGTTALVPHPTIVTP